MFTHQESEDEPKVSAFFREFFSFDIFGHLFYVALNQGLDSIHVHLSNLFKLTKPSLVFHFFR